LGKTATGKDALCELRALPTHIMKMHVGKDGRFLSQLSQVEITQCLLLHWFTEPQGFKQFVVGHAATSSCLDGQALSVRASANCACRKWARHNCVSRRSAPVRFIFIARLLQKSAPRKSASGAAAP